jgi:Fis family transcriptional regulator, factor for inversion stimulation protein
MTVWVSQQLPLGPSYVPVVFPYRDLHPDLLAVSRLVGLSAAVVERELILATLSAAHGNRTHTAAILGVSIRTLRNKLAQYAAEAVELGDPGASSERRLRSGRVCLRDYDVEPLRCDMTGWNCRIRSPADHKGSRCSRSDWCCSSRPKARRCRNGIWSIPSAIS